MADINIVKSIRFKTGLPLRDIIKAIDELNSTNEDEIISHLRKQGVLKQQAREGRQTTGGAIFSYVHEDRIGVMLELKCETDFVSRSDVFKALGQDLVLHIAAYQPKFVSADQVDQGFIEKEIEIARSQLEQEGKPADMIEKILTGKMAKLANENSLLSQQFLKNPDFLVSDVIAQTSQSTGEKIEVSRFVVYKLNS